MQVFENSDVLPPSVQDAVIVIGNFDGVHKGHQTLIKAAREQADALGLPLGILSFDPHPRRFFAPDAAPFQLSSLEQRRRLFEHYGVDFLVIEQFDTAYSRMSAADFVTDILLVKCRTRHCFVGYNFHFGQDRSGTPDDLVDFGAQYGFGVTILDKVGSDTAGATYSSSAIRDLLRAGDFDNAAQMLGWQWEIDGPVIEGDKRGRSLGYPTANQAMGDYLRPPYGVYAVRATLDTQNLFPDHWLLGVANLGIRPMFKVKAPLLESFLFDFDQDIYGRNLRVQPIARLRGEMKFNDLDGLIRQMDMDRMEAQEILCRKARTGNAPL